MGGILWLGLVLWNVTDLRALAWSSALLTFAALVLVPLLIDLVRDPEESDWAGKILSLTRLLQFPAAILLAIACTHSAGGVAATLAVPWILVTWLLAVAGALRVIQRGLKPQWALCRDTGLLFMAVGGAWTLADRLGLHPLGFGTDIVQLTAVHFHFAGLVLPVVTGLVLREFPASRIAAGAGWGVLAGVPLVAVGITSTQLGQGHGAELFAALVLATSAAIIAALQWRLATQIRWPVSVRVLWAIAGMSLTFGMTLALLYSARGYGMPLPWLDLPWMRALHGTANALGFALCGAVGWTLANRR
jgi:hypothetical protein